MEIQSKGVGQPRGNSKIPLISTSGKPGEVGRLLRFEQCTGICTGEEVAAYGPGLGGRGWEV